MTAPWVTFTDVTLGYGRQAVLDRLTFALSFGEAVGLAGPNGAGKTTLLKGMLGLLAPRTGTITLAEGMGHSIGYVPQRGTIDDVFPFTVEEIVEMGIYGQIRPWQAPSAAHRQAIGQALAAVGLTDLTSQPFRDLSGGQKQRALLARALVADPRILVLDEPTHGLDVAQAQVLLELLDRLRLGKGLSLLIVSHDLPELLEHTQSILLLHQGGLAYSGPVGELTDALLSRIYGLPIHLHADLGEAAKHA